MNNDMKKIVNLAMSEDVGDGDLTSSLLDNKMIELKLKIVLLI